MNTSVWESVRGYLPLRTKFCRNLLQSDLRFAKFLQSIIWTDEAQFHRDGVTNFHSLHEWSHENQHSKKPTAIALKIQMAIGEMVDDG